MISARRLLTNDIGGNLETAVAQNEQRVNDADYIYARDVGIAWEVNTVVIRQDESEIDFNKISAVYPGRQDNLHVISPGIVGKAHTWGGGTFKSGGMAPLSAAGLHRAAAGLAHEAGHKFRGRHNADEGGDCMGGGSDFVGSVNGQYMLQYCKEEGSEKGFPGVIYSGVLPPFCMDDVANTTKDTPVTIDVLDNDYDGNGDQVFLHAVVAKIDKGGKAQLSQDKKTVVYTPPPGFVGLDRFTYTAVDATGAANQTGRVKVDVRAPGLAYYFPMDAMEGGKPLGLGPNNNKLTGKVWALNLSSYKGVVGNALYNDKLGERGFMTFPDVSPPGRCSVSVSLWVLYPDADSLKDTSVIVCDGGIIGASVEGGAGSGWGIGHRSGDNGFSFAGNISRNIPEESFDLRSDDPIETNNTDPS